MKKITLLFLMISLLSLSAETISISTGTCVPVVSREALEKRLGISPISMIRGQIKVGELATVYTLQKCVKAIKGSNETASFSCEIEKQIGTDREKARITRKTFIGSCI